MIRRVVLAAALLGACGDDRVDPPVTLEAYGLRVTVTPVPARIEVVRVSDDEVLFDGGTIALRAATAEIEAQTGAFRIEDDLDAPTLEVATFQRLAVDGDAITFTLGGPDGDAVGAATLRLGAIGTETARGTVELVVHTDPALGITRTSVTFASPAGEHLLGLGGQSFDVDHRGQTVPLWVEEDGIAKRDDDEYEGVWFLSGRRHSTHTPMPMMVSSRGFAAVVETDARAVFALASEGTDDNRLEAWEPGLTLRLFDGPDLPGAVDAMTAWVGRPAVPPRAIFAPWLDALYGSANVRRVAQKLRAEGVAVSAIWSEDWRGGNDEGTGYTLEEDWNVDRDLYPDFEDVADDLHADGYLWLTYNNTFLDESADVFGEAIDAGYTTHDADGAPYLFTGVKFRDAALLDLSNGAASAWARDVFADGLRAGADGWMADFGEWLQPDSVLASGEDPLRAHNRYPVLWAKLNWQLHSFFGARLQIYFMRSAWLGSQPYAQVMWAGDQQTDWTAGDGLPSVIPIGLGLGLTGFPYYGHDIGGYMSQLTVPTTKELWFRWCTLGALTPVMRTHHGRSARENWNWESDAETTAHLARWSHVHMQLVPYLEDLSAEFQAHGAPLMRPVAFGFPDAGDWAWTTTDEFLLGDRILVAPVLVEGATARDVTLPAGDWVPLLGGDAVPGGGTIAVDAPITEIPAFVPGGAAIRMYPASVDTVLADLPAPVVVVYPGVAPDGATWNETVELTWNGRDPSLAPPTTVTIDGTPAALVRDGDDLVVQVPSNDTLVSITFEGGGTAVTRQPGAFELRLRMPP